MTAAYRLRGLGWFVSTVIVVLGFYLVSLQVAAERKRMVDLSAAIAKAHRDIRQLETEFDTRANMTQLERWNGEILALAAPTADQIVASEEALVQLASLTQGPDPARVEGATLVVPALHEMPAIEGAGSAAPAPRALPVAAQRADAVGAPAIVRPENGGAALSLPPAPVRRADRKLTEPVRSRAVAMLDRKLVRKSRLDDLIRAIPLDVGAAR